jgi:hypothetical protein
MRELVRGGVPIQGGASDDDGRRMGAVVPWEWDDTTEAPGGAEEANRRWPEGRGEQGREQGKGHPSSGVFEGR